MASIDSVVAHLRHAVDDLHRAAAKARGARDMAEELRALFDGLGAEDLVARMRAIAERSEELLAMLTTGIDAGERLIVQTEAVRRGGTAGGGGEVTPVVRTAPAAPDARPAEKAPVTSGWRRRLLGEVPEHVREAGARLRRRAPDDYRFTTGIVDGQEVQSGGNDRSLAADLDHTPLKGPPVTFYEHVESKVTAAMRREKRQRAEVVIDNVVCGTSERDKDDRWTCDRILESTMPAGSRLVVWVTCDGGTTFWRRTYFGSGERIRR